ncbi:MAG: DUF4276 family protein [Deltaproteobacteria bacterium]|nr:DUF4276 family protein [Deltaproteobacteria bacterium]
MKFVLFVEGHTEKKAIPGFIKRWLDPKLSPRVGIQVVRFNGCRELIKDAPVKALMHLNKQDVLAGIALLDLYGPDICTVPGKSADERCDLAKKRMEKDVGCERFYQFFAVHEIEAWLLSDPGIFPHEIRSALPAKVRLPEEVNFDQPPAKLLDAIYTQQTGRTYKKVVYGKDLFDKLDPDKAYDKCPHLKQLLDGMLKIAKESVLSAS